MTATDPDSIRQEIDRLQQRLSELNGSSPESPDHRDRLLQDILETALDGIITIDQSGLILSVNPAAVTLFGYSEAELLGSNVSRLMPSPYRDEHDGYLANYLASGDRKIIGIGREVVGLCQNGTTFPMELSVTEIKRPEGSLFTGFVRDLSERKLLEFHLRQHEKLTAVGQLAAGAAHEIGNPLSSISALVQTVARKIDDPGLVEKLHLVGKHIQRISNTVRQLVDFAGPTRTEWAETSINELIEQSLEIVRFDRRGRGVDIELDLEPELPRIWCMPELLEQVFINLALNAFDALGANSASDKRVRVSTGLDRLEGGAVIRVEFQDNGPGMTRTVASRAFEPFFTTKAVGKGTGLGLAVSYGIIREHRGRIEIGSREESPDGARITVWIPQDLERPAD